MFSPKEKAIPESPALGERFSLARMVAPRIPNTKCEVADRL